MDAWTLAVYTGGAGCPINAPPRKPAFVMSRISQKPESAGTGLVVVAAVFSGDGDCFGFACVRWPHPADIQRMPTAAKAKPLTSERSLLLITYSPFIAAVESEADAKSALDSRKLRTTASKQTAYRAACSSDSLR